MPLSKDCNDYFFSIFDRKSSSSSSSNITTATVTTPSSQWYEPLLETLIQNEATYFKNKKEKLQKESCNDNGASRAAESGADLTCLRPTKDLQPAVDGTTILIPEGLTRSMEDEFCNTEYWEAYDYVVNQKAREGGGEPNDEKSPSLRDDEGHEGWTLLDFMKLERCKSANLSMAEVAALRLFTSPWYAAANKALRSGKEIVSWATTISLLISGLLKLSVLNPPKPLYRALKGKLAEGAVVGSAHIDPAVLGCSEDPKIAAMYAGDPPVPAVILCIEPTFGSRAGFIDDIGQNPNEKEWMFTPFTVLEILAVRKYNQKSMVRVRPSVSPMRHYTHKIRYPWTSPTDPLTWEEYDVLEETVMYQQQQQQEPKKALSYYNKETKFASNAGDLITGHPKIAALGLETYMKRSMALPSDGVAKIEREFTNHGTDLDKRWFNYIMHEQASEVVNDWGIRDEGRNGEGLDYFHNHPNSQIAGLTLAHVLALRLYTSPAFKSLNTPLRSFKRDERGHVTQPLTMEAPHHFPVTIAFIDDGIRKLRAVEAAKLESIKNTEDKEISEDDVFEQSTVATTRFFKEKNEQILWRGMKHKNIKQDFIQNGGVEMAPMSTSHSLKTAIQYAKKGQGSHMIFRIITRSFMDRGADIEFLSTFPKEKECLYPPLTFLAPTGRSQRIGKFFVIEITVRL